jgi:hypothetical protein
MLYFVIGPDFVARGMSSPSTSQPPAVTDGESTTANDNARPHDPGEKKHIIVSYHLSILNS